MSDRNPDSTIFGELRRMARTSGAVGGIAAEQSRQLTQTQVTLRRSAAALDSGMIDSTVRNLRATSASGQRYGTVEALIRATGAFSEPEDASSSPILFTADAPVTDLALSHDGFIYAATGGKIYLHPLSNRYDPATFENPALSAWRIAPAPAWANGTMPLSSGRLTCTPAS